MLDYETLRFIWWLLIGIIKRGELFDTDLHFI